MNDGLYEVFDGVGRPLRFVTNGNTVSIEVPVDSTPAPSALRRRLKDYIREVGADRVGVADLDDASLRAMLAALLSFQRA
ncbi:MAG: hypothetical protein ACRDT9_02275 [Agromyces sp.]